MTKPAPYLRLQREHPDLVEAYERFASVAHEAGPLSDRERRLVKLAIAIASASEGATHSHARQALASGIGLADLRHVALLTASTMGFPVAMRALSWIGDVVDDEEI
jgi:4-carboxymuconolactone decarboxylase